MPLYSVKLKLYDSTGDNNFTIDQSGTSGNTTHITSQRDSFTFDKSCVADDFVNSSGASLSLLNDFVGETSVKNYITSSQMGKGSNVLVVSNTGDYTTIQEAVNASSDGGMIYIVNDTYSENITLDPLKSLTLVGESKENVILQSPGGLVSDIFLLSFPSTKNYNFKNMTVSNCRNGLNISAVSTGNITVKNINFINCGWNGTLPLSEDAGSYSTLWASTDTSDGHAIKIAGCDKISISDVNIEKCSTGLFLQDILSGGKLMNINSCDTLNTSIYLASSSGSGTSGCKGVNISNCNLKCSRGHGIKVVGGGRTKILSCSLEEIFSSGVLLENTLETDMTGTILMRCNLHDYIGTGNIGGDATGTLAVHGAVGVDETPYVLNASGCTLSCGGSGGEAVPYAIYAKDVLATVNVSGCGYICFDVSTRVNDPDLVTDAQQGFFASQIHEM